MHTSSYMNVLTSSSFTLETPLQGLRVYAYTSIGKVEATVERIKNSYTSIENLESGH